MRNIKYMPKTQLDDVKRSGVWTVYKNQSLDGVLISAVDATQCTQYKIKADGKVSSRIFDGTKWSDWSADWEPPTS